MQFNEIKWVFVIEKSNALASGQSQLMENL